MVEYIVDAGTQSDIARFGRLEFGDELKFVMPATAPTPRTEYEARATAYVAERGCDLPVVVVPLARMDAVNAALTPVFGDPRNRSLVESSSLRPLILPDIESEALSFGCLARRRFLEHDNVPKSVQELMKSGLRADLQNGRKESGAAWEAVRRRYGLAGLREWEEKHQAQAGSVVFFAPTPIVRASRSSVKRAFEIGWNLVDTVEDPIFRARGIHFLIHSELFREFPAAADARIAFMESLREMYASPSPRVAPLISAKIYDGSHYLTEGIGAKVARQILREFMLEGQDHIRAARGFSIVHDFGTWALGPLDCGVDVVSFRCDGKKFEIDPLWGEQPPESPLKYRRMKRMPTKIVCQPFDPEELCDGRIADFKASWKKNESFRSAENVPPLPWWTWSTRRQREYRAGQIIGSLLAVGKEFRKAGHDSMPLAESVRGRVARMKEQDAMLDLCPSL